MEENNKKKGLSFSYILLVISLLIIIAALGVLVYKAYTNKNNGNGNGSNSGEVNHVLTEADKKAILKILNLTENGYERITDSDVKALELDSLKEYIDISGPKVINALLAIQKTGNIDINLLDVEDIRDLVMFYAVNNDLCEKSITSNGVYYSHVITKATYKSIAKVFGITLTDEEVFPSNYRVNDYLVDHNEGYVSCYVSIVDSLSFTMNNNIITLKYNIRYERPDENNVTLLTHNKLNDKTITLEFVKDQDSYAIKTLNIVNNINKNTNTTSDVITETEKTDILNILGISETGYNRVTKGEKETSNLDVSKDYADLTNVVLSNFVNLNNTGLIRINSLDKNILTLIIINYAKAHNLTVSGYTDSNGNLVAAVNKTNTEKIARIFGINMASLSLNNGYLVYDSGFATDYVQLTDSVNITKANNIITLTYNIKYEKEVSKDEISSRSKLVNRTLTFEFSNDDNSYILESLKITNN